MANKTVRIDQLSTALAVELEGYSEGVKDRVEQAGEKAVKKLVKLTKASAPEKTGSFKRHITWTAKDTGLGVKKFFWHVKAPDHRLTHLLVHGHAGNGHRGNPFLHKALDTVLPEYLEDVEEALTE